MIPTDSKILLVGNGLYLNRGCEAIVRGSMKIFEHAFRDCFSIRAGVMAMPEPVAEQNRAERDKRITSFSITPVGRRGSRKWLESQFNKRFGTRFEPELRDLYGEIANAAIALEIGGDNYTLDYGRPTRFMAMDRYLMKHGIPVVIWGASVGSFDEDHQFAPRIFDHLRNLSAVFVRETESRDYLANRGVNDNVQLVADPAFLMQSVKPVGLANEFVPDEETLGVNFSPLVGRFRNRGAGFDLLQWTAECVANITALDSLKRPILLIPHVGSREPNNDDFAFLRQVHAKAAACMKSPVKVLPPNLSAAELKWIIGRCAAFAGARTHSTIAAFSSEVPTLSIGYSLKARGINRDLFGSLDYCVPVSDLTPGIFAEKMKGLLDDAVHIRRCLHQKLPQIRELAMSAGEKLRSMCRR